MKLLAVLLAFGVLAAPASAQAPKIYSSLPMHGPLRPQSLDSAAAMRLPLEECGAAGEYVSLDDSTKASGTWDVEQVAFNARTAAGDAATIAYLGEFNSGASAISI